MANSARWLTSWLPLVLWMGLIFLGSTDHGSAAHTMGFVEPLLRWLLPRAPDASIDRLHFLIRKCAHITEYAILGGLALRAIAAHRPGKAPAAVQEKKSFHRWRLAGAALVLAALYAASDEFHQSFVPSRGASVEDVCIDAVGASLGIALVTLWRKRHDKQESLT